jgi:hypothetical protein
VRRYVPKLKEFDKKFAYEPWKAPVVDQRRVGLFDWGMEM